MVPERFAEIRQSMDDLGDEIHDFRSQQRTKARWTLLLRLATVIALLYLGWSIRMDRQARAERCVKVRTEDVRRARAIANGSADGLLTVVLASPRNTTPEAQAVATELIERYRREYTDNLLAATPKPEDC